jgi:hypothetical protein
MRSVNYRKFRLPRVWSNQELRKVAPLFSGRVINVSAGENVDKEGTTYDTYFTKASEFWMSNFSPGAYRGFRGADRELLIDLEQELPQKHMGQFDVAFNHTTLEHIFHVTKAFENICKLSKDVVILVVPFAQEQHENDGYLDFWRFTPTCLRRLFSMQEMTVVYESANNHCNAGTYIFMVAAKDPERWRPLMPAHPPIGMAATWIGSSWARWLASTLRMSE